jgi:hypothetical protein
MRVEIPHGIEKYGRNTRSGGAVMLLEACSNFTVAFN